MKRYKHNLSVRLVEDPNGPWVPYEIAAHWKAEALAHLDGRCYKRFPFMHTEETVAKVRDRLIDLRRKSRSLNTDAALTDAIVLLAHMVQPHKDPLIDHRNGMILAENN